MSAERPGGIFVTRLQAFMDQACFIAIQSNLFLRLNIIYIVGTWLNGFLPPAQAWAQRSGMALLGLSAAVSKAMASGRSPNLAKSKAFRPCWFF